MDVYPDDKLRLITHYIIRETACKV